MVRDKGKFKGICAAPHWEGGRTPLGSETLLALGKNLGSPPPRKELSGQNQDGAQHQRGSCVTCEGAPGRRRGLEGVGQAPPLRWGQGLSAEGAGRTLRRGATALVEAAATSAPARLPRTRRAPGVRSCSDTSCPAFSDCRQVSVQSPGWGRMPLFPTFSSPHSLGRGSQSSGSGETAPFYSNVSSPLDFATAASAATHQPLQCPVPLEVRMGGRGRFSICEEGVEFAFSSISLGRGS